MGGQEDIGIPYRERVPRHLISTFTGFVSVEATLSLNESDKEKIVQRAERNHGLIIDRERMPNEVTLEKRQNFRDGDFDSYVFSLKNEIHVKGSNQRKWRLPEGSEIANIKQAIYNFTPDIAYFPTFVFEFPEKIYLTNRGEALDKFYRRVFQDILDYDGKGHTIEKDVIRRIRGEPLKIPWIDFYTIWLGIDDRDKIQHVMDRAGAAVTKLVFGRWNKIFHEDVRGKEVSINYQVVEGETVNEKGAVQKTNEHDVFITFQIRDGTRRFNVNDRSLGFRWFFAFMLFTQFRVSRTHTRPLLFLFDEPASNLHAAAQQKLIESFPEIARGENVLVYSTHSHYMIEPKWLEQTFIVTNRSDAPAASVLDGVSLDDESLDIKVDAYRSFVNAHPTQTSYFQPILDRLEVVPSRFDLQRSSVIVEGKSDYYVLRYAMKALNIPDFAILPGTGAGTLGALVALHVGWNLHFLFLLDGDQKGQAELKRYVEEYGIASNRLCTLSDLAVGIRVIENLLDNEALDKIKADLGLTAFPTKNQVRRFFQEKLASDQVSILSPGFGKKAQELLSALGARL
jgi:hypothetical protein